MRTIAFYKISFSIRIPSKSKNSYDLVLGSIPEDFIEVLEAISKMESITKFKTALDTGILEKTSSELYLNRNVELPNFSNIFVALINNCMFHKHLLDQHEDLIKQRISILNFLPKTKYRQSKGEYNK